MKNLNQSPETPVHTFIGGDTANENHQSRLDRHHRYVYLPPFIDY